MPWINDIVILLCNVFTANKAYLKMQLSYENTYSFASSALTQLRSTEGYREDSKVAILGSYDVPDFYLQQFRDVCDIMGTNILTPTTWAMGSFFRYYMGADLNLVTEAEGAALMETPEYAAMEVFPNYGSVEKISDVFVIKLSD